MSFILEPIDAEGHRTISDHRSYDLISDEWPEVCRICGYVIEDGEHTDRRWPIDNHGIFYFKHAHQWEEWRMQRQPVGCWTLIFRCAVCGDQMDSKQSYDGTGQLVCIVEQR